MAWAITVFFKALASSLIFSHHFHTQKYRSNEKGRERRAYNLERAFLVFSVEAYAKGTSVIYTKTPPKKAPSSPRIYVVVNIFRVVRKRENVLGAFRISRACCVVSSFVDVEKRGGKGSRKKMLSAVKAYLKIHVQKKKMWVGLGDCLTHSSSGTKRKIAEIPSHAHNRTPKRFSMKIQC